MNRYTRPLPVLALLGILAACGPAAEEAPSASPAQSTVTVNPTATATAMASDSPSAMPSHDMVDMGGPAEAAAVQISNFAFAPAGLTVAVGTEVTFTNLDSAPHTVTAGSDDAPSPELFDSGLLQQGESFTSVFDEPGTYAYFCDRHPPMEGSISVEK